MPFNFGDVTNETFSEDLRRAAGYKPFLLEDAKTILARYGDNPTNIQKNMTDTELYNRAVNNVIEKYKKDKATAAPAGTTPAKAPAPTVPTQTATPTASAVESAMQPAEVGATEYPMQTQGTYVQPQSYPALTTGTSYASNLSLTTVQRVLAQMGAPASLVPPPSALVNETALKNYLIKLGYR